MSFQLNIFILLFGALQGTLLSFFLLRNKRRLVPAYSLLVIYIAVMVLQIVLKVMSKEWLIENLLWLYAISYEFPLLYGPLAYLIAVHLLNPQKKFSYTELLHMAPLVVFVSDTFLSFFPGQEFIPHLISIILYHVIALIVLHKHEYQLKGYFSSLHDKRVSWLRIFLISSFAVSLIIEIAIYLLYVHNPTWNDARWGFVTLTVFVYWISYVALNQPETFIQVLTDVKEKVSFMDTGKLTFIRSSKKYENSGLTEVEYKKIVDSLQHCMETQKPHLNPEINVDTLAKILNCTKHHLSQVLNEHYHQTFYEFINKFRVEEAKNLLLKSEDGRTLKMAAVAYDAGFNSISSFNEVFKKTTGKTPSDYRKQQRSISQQAGL